MAELIRQLGWTRTRTRILHYRDRQQAEVDVIIEAPDGRVARSLGLLRILNEHGPPYCNFDDRECAAWVASIRQRQH